MPIHRLLICWLAGLFLSGKAMGQTAYWQQKADYRMSVNLNPADHSLQGKASIQYQNNSPDSLAFIWFHCWPNAYRNDRTAFSEQLLRLNRLDFYFSADADRGYLNQLVMKVNGLTARLDQDPLNQDIVKVILPQPLPPGQSITIEAGFHVQLPRIFSRLGYRQGFYAITQWYPKPAVYDFRGWHPMPYLDQGEFYSEYGNYDVTITVPDGYTIAASGIQEDSSHSNGLTAYHFRQDKIHDFAWFASKKFKLSQDTLQSIDGRIIQLKTFVLPGHEKAWSKSMDYLKAAIRFRESMIGSYPYTIAQVVDGFQGEGGGGMEYPTITVLNDINDEYELNATLEHEIGHNWFYAALGTNERDYPWLDEGLNTYYDRRYEKYFPDPRIASKKQKKYPGPVDPENWLISGLESIHRDQPINTAANQFNAANYGLIPYYKTALWLEQLAAVIGQQALDSAIRNYYRQYAFRHPQPEDLQRLIISVNPAAAPYFDQLQRTGPIKEQVFKSFKPVFLFDASGQQSHRTIGIGPIPGYNFYDGFQPGIVVHNFQLPLPGFRFLLAPMYGTRSRSINGLAHFSYHYYPGNNLQAIEAGINLLRFSGNETVLTPQPAAQHFQKIQPYLKLVQHHDPLSKKETWIRISSFFFREDQLNAKQVINGPDTGFMYSLSATHRQLQQATIFLADHRMLYPYSLEAKLEYCPEFTRLAVTGEYFFNYPGKHQGLQVRAFAGKFIYNGSKTALKALELDRYHLNLTGANGYEDYTYSNYFFGRNRFDGWMSQQIMLRDGGFKVRTDLYSAKIGKTDDWLAALNFSSTLPDRFNPLLVLPVKIPIRLFADLGTFAEAWTGEQNQNRFLFDAGIQLSFLRNLVNIYLPIVNSKVFRDYNQSTLGKNRWLKTISFSIDIQQLSAHKWLAKAGL